MRMVLNQFPWLSLLGLAVSTAVAGGQTSSVPADWIPAHDSLAIVSSVMGETRLVNVYTPPRYARSPRAHFPVLYMPDGGIDEDFPHIVNTVDSLITLGIIRPVIVVGIPNTQRRRDLTGPTRVKSDSAIAPQVGRSAVFREFIRVELIPYIDAHYRTAPERSIVGESLAGLFVVETFFDMPKLFDHYLAFDPSLWWNGGALVGAAVARLNNMDSSPRSLYFAASKDDVGNATARLAAVIQAGAPSSLTRQFESRPDLTHATIFRALVPAALARALR